MKHALRRLAACMMAIILLTFSFAQAETIPSYRYNLSFHLNEQAFSPEMQPLMAGLAGIAEILNLSGEYVDTGDSFDVQAEMILNQQEDTRTPIHWYGNRAYWGFRSSLLGHQTVMINLEALLEFSMKAYMHLNIPLQRAAMLISSFVHTDGLQIFIDPWQKTMNASEGTRLIPKEDVLSMLRTMSDSADNNRNFIYWSRALALESGYDEAISSFVAQLPQWAETFLGEEGVQVTVDQGMETWQTGDTTFAICDANSFEISLPETPEGYLFNANYNANTTDQQTHRQVFVEITQEDETILFASADISYPADIQAGGNIQAHVVTRGLAAGDGTDLTIQGTLSETGELHVALSNQKGEEVFSVQGTLQATTTDQIPHYTYAEDLKDSFGLMFMNEASLSEFVQQVKLPMILGMLPILDEIPLQSCQAILDWLEQSGVFGLLAAGLSTVEDEEEPVDLEGEEEFADDEFFVEDDEGDDFIDETEDGTEDETEDDDDDELYDYVEEGLYVDYDPYDYE